MCKLFLVTFCLLACGLFPQMCKTTAVDTLEGAALKVATFNVQIFGAKKMANQMVRAVLIKVILRYDIILIQEIRSRDDGPIDELLADVNRYSSPPGIYKLALSIRLGRSVSKEQYGFLYRSDKVTLKDSYVYDDNKGGTAEDKFQREPFIVRFEAKNAYVTDFALAAIHTSPSEAEKEIDHLVDVYDDITQRWKLKDVMIMGDFNAGCSYVTKSEWSKIRLATDRRFYWLFGNHVDTTVAKSDCPYDRMVIAGYNMIRGILADSAKVFNFKEAYGLDQEEAARVSDHWPIEIQFKDSSYKDEELFFHESVKVTNNDDRMDAVSKYDLYPLRSKTRNPLLSQNFTVQTLYSDKGSMEQIILEYKTSSAEVASDAVKAFHEYFPKLVSPSQVTVSARQILKIAQDRHGGCVAKQCEATIFQMLSNTCNDVKVPKLNAVQLCCSVSLRLCEIDIIAAN